MRYIVSGLLLAAISLGSHKAAQGHGFALSLVGNSLVATSPDTGGTGNTRIFVSNFEEDGNLLVTEHGSAGTTLFGNGKALGFDIVGKLWYANNGVAVPASSTLSLKIEDQVPAFTGPFRTINGNSIFTSGFPFSGSDTHEFYSTLSASSGSIPEGVYGFAWYVRGGPAAGGSYTPTPLLITSWFTPEFDLGEDPLAPDGNLARSANAIFTAATALVVPEPSSLALIAMAGGSLLVVAQRRRGRMVNRQ